ncbi:ATPase [Mycobacterium sp. OAE908]|uniref:ATPase n=1 Tax=Mycobacterium sp. OAE908 TaxID=2817899 RepID=UPI001AE38E96
MSGKHRKSESRTKKIAVVSVATATATALTVGAAPPPPKPAPEPVIVHKDVDLAAAFRPFTDPGQIPDLTFGLGTAAYDFSQTAADLLLRAIVDHVNLSALAKAAGLDLPSLLQEIPTSLLSGVLGAIPINLTGVLGDALGPVTGSLLIQALDLIGVTDNGNTTLIKLLDLLGLDLSDPLNLANLDLPGVKLITAGPPFTLLKLLGLDLGWVPGLPNSVASAINNTTYLDVGLKGLLNTVIGKLEPNVPVLDPVLTGLKVLVNTLPVDVDVAQVRIPVVVGFGLGAFAAGAAYDKVLADLPNQPGGVNYTGTDPLLGSFTVLPMVLLRNPGRANGGLFARMFPLAGLFGIDTVTPETEVTHSGGIPILNTGLALGGANLVPIKIDGTVQYDILSDFAAWPNPFSIANSLMGAVLPTYLLRGIDTSNLTPQLLEQIQAALQRTTDLNEPLSLNLYLTLATNSLPLLEPLYLAADVMNLATFGALPNPFERLANALAPALTSLTNLGYTDVVRNPDGTYTRTLDEAGVPTPFLSFPDVNWGLVPGDIITSLVNGFQKEFLSGNPTPGTPNAITGLLKLLTGVLDPLGGLGDILGGLNLTQLVSQQVSPVAADAVPSADAKMVTLSANPDADLSTGKHAAAADAAAPEDTGTTPKHAADETETATDETTPTTTDPDESTTSPKPPSTTTPKPTSPRNPVGDVVGGAGHVVAGAVGGVTHEVATGVAGVLKSLAPKKTTTSTTSTNTKSDTEKDSTGGGAGGASSTASKPAA